MKFDEEFPSLKGKRLDIRYNDVFPSDGPMGDLVHITNIELNCIDKQRHKKLMEQALKQERQRVREAWELAYRYAEGQNGLCDCSEEGIRFLKIKFFEALGL